MARKQKHPKTDITTPIADALVALAVPIGSVKIDPRNARVHAKNQIREIARSLQRFGQRKPIVVNRATGIVEAGNGLLLAARQLGWTDIAAVFVDDDPDTATGFAIADNRLSDISAFDDDVLISLIADMGTRDIPGYTQAELDSLIGAVNPGDAGDAEPEGVPSELSGYEFRVVIDCQDEEHQRALLERFNQEGLPCRALIS